MKRTVSFTIYADVIDCYLYAGYLFLFFANARICYVDYHIVVRKLKERYPQYAHLIDLIFLHNEYSKSYAAKLIFAVKEIHDAMTLLWKRAADEIDLVLEYKDIEESCKSIGEWKSIPLDIRMYAMRLYMGCRNGLYESKLNIDDNYILNPSKLKKCFDGKVISVNANYSSIVASADWDGLYAGVIDDNESQFRLNEKVSLASRSIRTGWAGTDLISYDTSSSFRYLNNDTARVESRGTYKKADLQEQRKITKFAKSVLEMQDLFNKTSLLPEEIIYSFNSSERGFFFMRDGSFKNATFRSQKENNDILYISKNIKEEKFNKIKGRMQKPLSSTLVPNGCIIEFYDSVVLFQNGESYVLSNEPSIKVRSYMGSRNYRDIASIISDGKVVFHSLYTLDLIKSTPAFPLSVGVNKGIKNKEIEELPF